MLKVTGPQNYLLKKPLFLQYMSKDASLAVIYVAIGDLLSCFSVSIPSGRQCCCRDRLRIISPQALSKPQVAMLDRFEIIKLLHKVLYIVGKVYY